MEATVSRYDDPRWYEEQHADPASPPQPAYDDFDQYPYPLHSQPNNSNGHVPHYTVEARMTDKVQQLRRVFGQIIALIALVVVAFLGGWFSHQYLSNSFNANNQSKSYEQLFQQAWSTIDQNYVDRKAVNYKTMSYAAIQAMVDSLKDKGHTRFLTPDQVKSENQQLSGKFTGVGIYLRQDPKTKNLIITAPIPGSPAEKAGIKHGDIILAVDGKSVAGKDVNGVSSLIKGSAGTSLTLTIKRAGVQQPLNIRMVRAEINVPNVVMHYIAQDHIAHIQVVQFTDGISGQIKDTINKAKSMGAKKIILDLRDNPGGYLNEAINTDSLFMKNGNVLLEQDSSGKRTPQSVNGNPIDTTIPIVVLVNGNSASAAEIVTGGLQDNGRAYVIGEQTFGTGTVLQQFNLSDGSAILIGTQEWLTPKGKFIRGTDTTHGGITPNMTVTLGSNASPLLPNDENASNMTLQQILTSGDTQLAAAIKYLDGH
jgi:carboxyl-terminal processing protease